MLFTEKEEETIGIEAIVPLLNKFLILCCSEVAATEPGIELVLIVILTVTEPYLIEITVNLLMSELMISTMALRKSK